MSASVDIITETKDDILVIPIQSVAVRVLDKDAEDKEYEEVVFLYEADTARMVAVSTGIQDDEYIHITEGIEKGIEVISGPYSALSKELDNGTELRKKDGDDNSDGDTKS